MGGNVLLGAGPFTVTGTANTTYSGVISGSGRLDQIWLRDAHSCRQNLQQRHNDPGPGTVELGNGGTTGSLCTTGIITDNGNLTLCRSNTVVQGTDLSTSDIVGTGSVTQAGSGTLVLNQANTYSGPTNVMNGSLVLGASTALPCTTVVTLGDSVNNTTGQLDLMGTSPTIQGLESVGTSQAQAGQIVGNSGSTPLTLTVSGTGNNGSSIFDGVLQDGPPGSTSGGSTLAVVVTGTRSWCWAARAPTPAHDGQRRRQHIDGNIAGRAGVGQPDPHQRRRTDPGGRT